MRLMRFDDSGGARPAPSCTWSPPSAAPPPAELPPPAAAAAEAPGAVWRATRRQLRPILDTGSGSGSGSGSSACLRARARARAAARRLGRRAAAAEGRQRAASRTARQQGGAAAASRDPAGDGALAARAHGPSSGGPPSASARLVSAAAARRARRRRRRTATPAAAAPSASAPPTAPATAPTITGVRGRPPPLAAAASCAALCVWYSRSARGGGASGFQKRVCQVCANQLFQTPTCWQLPAPPVRTGVRKRAARLTLLPVARGGGGRGDALLADAAHAQARQVGDLPPAVVVAAELRQRRWARAAAPL